MEQKRRQALQQVEVCKLLAANGLRLCEEAEFGVQNCQHTIKFDAR
jgi:hypothetical protein